MAIEQPKSGPPGVEPDTIGTAQHNDNQLLERTVTGNDDIQKIPVMDQVDEFGAHAKTDPKEITLVKKLDYFILNATSLMNFLDRNAMVNARLNGLEDDLGLVGTQYNTCVSILFVGYICGQIPSNMALNRVRPSWFMAGFSMAWSIVSLLTFLVKDYQGMLVARLFLGITEAPFYPGALYLISMFYTRKEIATRMSLFYTANMLASSFSGLIAAGIFDGLDGSMGLEGWRWLFIIQGAISVLVSVLAYFMLPDHPLKTSWLTPEQRQLAHNRICLDTTDHREGTSVWVGLREAVSDWRTWILCLMYNFHLSSTSFQNFLPTVVETLGYTRTITLVLTFPPYFFAAVMGIFIAWSSGRHNERTWHVTLCKIVVVGGFIIPAVTTNVPARMVGIFLFVGFSFGINNVLLGWVSATVGQTNEKKAVSLALCNTLGNLSSVYMPYIWPSSHGPRYLPAWMASIAFSVGVIAMAWVLKMALKRQNKKIRENNPGETNFYVY